MAKKTGKAGRGTSETYEGRQDHIPGMKMPEIETWEFQYPGSATTLEVSVPEFTCICPKTGLPDFATLVISYVPGKLCLELKSFKEYINSFRDLGIFHEHVVNRVLADCVKACKPRSMEVRGVFNARGGIQTTAAASYRGR
ncbi:MAG TPA: preQ(1) synthase [Fibrobacteria bacterium]|jgi:7-cyano-7-deazaguanine reductase|nr:preQ(1) synthase [Fibrobacteria bacterium]